MKPLQIFILFLFVTASLQCYAQQKKVITGKDISERFAKHYHWGSTMDYWVPITVFHNGKTSPAIVRITSLYQYWNKQPDANSDERFHDSLKKYLVKEEQLAISDLSTIQASIAFNADLHKELSTKSEKYLLAKYREGLYMKKDLTEADKNTALRALYNFGIVLIDAHWGPALGTPSWGEEVD